MGGSHQSTCPPPSKSSVKSLLVINPGSLNPIRSHEVTSRGEVDFHDDQAGLKCAVDSAGFFSAYDKWRPLMEDELILAGNDGSGGRSCVTLIPYVDDQGRMQVAMSVKKTTVGATLTDLDTLAHFQ